MYHYVNIAKTKPIGVLARNNRLGKLAEFKQSIRRDYDTPPLRGVKRDNVMLRLFCYSLEFTLAIFESENVLGQSQFPAVYPQPLAEIA